MSGVIKLTHKQYLVLQRIKEKGSITPQGIAKVLCPEGRKLVSASGRRMLFDPRGAGFLGGGYAGKLKKLGLVAYRYNRTMDDFSIVITDAGSKAVAKHTTSRSQP